MRDESKADREPNYYRERRLLTTHYLYLDREPWIADRLFIGSMLTVHFCEEYESKKCGYMLVHVWVWGWKEKEFEHCMERLYKTSLLTGRDDYPQACSFLGEILAKI